MPAKLSTHVLDTTCGCPAAGMRVELWRIDNGRRAFVTAAMTNANGRTDEPLLSGDDMIPGQYEIVFFVGDYFAARDTMPPKAPFLDQVPVRFGVADAGGTYHVPLLCTPWSYSIYRGS